MSDAWHYPRQNLAKQVLSMFESGISSALIFFAPRRMGKTEFLCKDIMPLAKKHKWKVFYFSFLDVNKHASAEFTNAITIFAHNEGALKKESLLQRLRKIGGEAGGIRADIELGSTLHTQKTMKEVIELLCKRGKILLLMDEVQALTQDPDNANFIASLRTILDINKGQVKVIFTGSSQTGLRNMFSQAKAPFFHFGQNLIFPELERGFTDHLAQMFEKVTKRKLDHDKL
jgi:predicted AAA+ superfamily ATPase